MTKSVGIWALSGYTRNFWDDTVPAFDGMRWQLWNITNELRKCGYNVASLEDAPLVPNELPAAQMSDIDIAIIHPRWHMFNTKYTERAKEYLSFLDLMKRLLLANKRIILLDYDLSLNFNMIDELTHYNQNVRIVHLLFTPPDMYRNCYFLPFPFWAEGMFTAEKHYDAVYIGSEYGGKRLETLQKFFTQSIGNNLIVGRWDNVPQNVEHVSRVSHPEAMRYLAQGKTCLWVARDDSVQYGAITSKISEAIAVGTPLTFLQQTTYSAILDVCKDSWQTQAACLKLRIPEMDKTIWMTKFLELLED